MKKKILIIFVFAAAVIACASGVLNGGPRYPGLITFAVAQTSTQSVTTAGVTYYTTEEETAVALRAQMVKRKSTITVYYLVAGSVPSTIVDDIYDIAVEYTGNGFEGDYLFRHIGTYSSTSETDYPCVVTKTEYKEGTLVKLTYSFNWRDTTAQEEAVEKALNKVMAKIIDSSMSDYEKAKAIYEWIATTVEWDQEAYDAQDVIRHTAYDALVKHKANCLGYSNTFYLMANEAGLQCRVIGTAAHVYNMVKVDGAWYLVDTQVAANSYAHNGYLKYSYFLRGSKFIGKLFTEPKTTFGVTLSKQDYTALGTVSLSYTSCEYTGKAKKPAVTVTSADGDVLTEDADYTVAYSDNIDAGIATVTVTGTGDYSGTATIKFTIKKKSIEDATITLSKTNYTYNGETKTPSVKCVELDGTALSDENYIVTYPEKSKMPGTYTVTITGTGNYKGTAEAVFTIKAISLASANVTIEKTDYVYDGAAKEPDVTSVVLNGAELVCDTDYTVSYSDNVNAGTALVTVTGTGIYGGSVTAKFTIKCASISEVAFSVSLSSYDYVYDGTEIEPVVIIKYKDASLTEGTDYSVTYSSNISVGEGVATITGAGNFKGETEETFIIEPASIEEAVVATYAERYIYSGDAIEPLIMVRLNGTRLSEDTDYTITFSDNTGSGTATADITGTGNYTGTASTTFDIVKDIASAVIGLSQLEYVYDGNICMPEVSVLMSGDVLAEGLDYSVEYKNNIVVGTAEVVVTGEGGYAGVASAEYDIVDTATAVSETYTVTTFQENSFYSLFSTVKNAVSNLFG